MGAILATAVSLACFLALGHETNKKLSSKKRNKKAKAPSKTKGTSFSETMMEITIEGLNKAYDFKKKVEKKLKG